jgi:hypothetical protein
VDELAFARVELAQSEEDSSRTRFLDALEGSLPVFAFLGGRRTSA